ncbi:MAG: glycosyltransferase [Syntrophaceae bacterium]|nr:glycosyltransferase [Syntrophaceae bacterium]
MKVLNIVKYYYPSVGGMETYVRQLCRGTLKYEITPSILTFNHSPRINTNWENVDEISVRRTTCQFKLFSQPISLNFGDEMKSLISETDLVHLHSPFPNAEVLYRHISKPLIITWCVDPANTRWGKLFPVFRPFLIRVLEMARKIILIAPSLLEHSPTLQPYEHKCEVIPLAYSSVKGTDAVSTVRKFDRTRPTVLFVGKLRKYKGIKYLINAIQRIPEAILRIVGDGEELSNLKNLAKKLGITAQVSFLGKISDEQLYVEYKKADLFVLPSIDASEAFGIVQAEAMSYGLPVINTDLPSGVPHVSLNEVTGITIPPRDSIALSFAIKRLCDDPDFYEKCSSNALQRAKLFTEENMVKRYVKLYKKCI